MTKNQIEYKLGLSQLQQKANELQLARNKYRDEAGYEYGIIYDNAGNYIGASPEAGMRRKREQASIALSDAQAMKAGADEKYGSGALGDLRRGLESIFPFLKTYRNIYGGE